MRFNQQCLFTPVSAGAQAFVPAHAAYPHLARGASAQRGRGGYPPQPPILYGAHGQPLPPPPTAGDPNMAQQPYYAPSYGQHGSPYDERAPPPLSHPAPGSQEQVSRKRPRLDDSHVVAPGIPLVSNSPSSHSSQQRPRRGSGGGYEYPDPTNLAPVSPATPYSGHSTTPQPYYSAPVAQPRRHSPPSTYALEARPGDSPHGSSASPSNYPYPGLHPGQSMPPRDSGVTPPPSGPGSANGRSAMSVRDMLSDGNPGRSSTDSDMLNALNRRV